MKRPLFVVSIVALSLIARADSWAPASVFAHVTEDGGIVVRVDPGVRTESGDMKPAHCSFFRYSAEKSAYEFWRGHDLVNPTLPVAVVVPDDGSFIVTFDDYMGIGTSENAVVVYDSDGRMLKRWALKDIFTESEIADLPESTMSIHWRGSVGVMHSSQHEVCISPAKSSFDATKKFKGFMLDAKALTIREDLRWK